MYILISLHMSIQFSNSDNIFHTIFNPRDSETLIQESSQVYEKFDELFRPEALIGSIKALTSSSIRKQDAQMQSLLFLRSLYTLIDNFSRFLSDYKLFQEPDDELFESENLALGSQVPDDFLEMKTEDIIDNPRAYLDQITIITDKARIIKNTLRSISTCYRNSGLALYQLQELQEKLYDFMEEFGLDYRFSQAETFNSESYENTSYSTFSDLRDTY